MTDLFTDRSRTIQYQRCPRSRFLAYHEGGLGLAPVKKSLALLVGGCFHTGAAYLLTGYLNGGNIKQDHPDWVRGLEDGAVAVALEEFHSEAARGLELEAGAGEGLAAQSASPAIDFGAAPASAGADGGATGEAVSPTPYELYLRAEQACLLEGMVRAWARRGLPRLLEEFEVLEVEREGTWLLSHVVPDYDARHFCDPFDLWWMSRPDALLRSRLTGDLVIQSFKTTGEWEKRKGKDAERDMQGLSEVVEVENRWGARSVTAIRYEYVLKGRRDWSESKNASRLAKQTAERFGHPAGVQQNPLCYLWAKAGLTVEDSEFAHSFSWTDESGAGRKLYYKDWTQAPVWEQPGGIAAWVDLLDRGAVQLEAQRDILAEQTLPAVTVYRTDDDLRDWLEQTEAQEVRVAQAAAQVAAAQDEAEKRHLLNVHFEQHRHSCSYPGECDFVPICYGGAEVRRDPMGSGKYVARVPNHPQELVQIGVGDGV